LFCVFFDILATFAPLRAKYEHSRKKKVIFSCSGTSGDSNAQLGADIPRSVEIHFRRVLSTFRPPKSSFSMETEIFRRYKIIKNSKKTDFPVFYVIANSQEIILSLGRFLCFLRFWSFFPTFWPLLPLLGQNMSIPEKKNDFFLLRNARRFQRATGRGRSITFGQDIPRKVEMPFRRVLSTFRPPKSSFPMETETLGAPKSSKTPKKLIFQYFMS
jgi:hypothetical protein